MLDIFYIALTLALFALVSLIALINTFNRLNVILQQPAGGYQVGQFA